MDIRTLVLGLGVFCATFWLAAANIGSMSRRRRAWLEGSELGSVFHTEVRRSARRNEGAAAKLPRSNAPAEAKLAIRASAAASIAALAATRQTR